MKNFYKIIAAAMLVCTCSKDAMAVGGGDWRWGGTNLIMHSTREVFLNVTCKQYATTLNITFNALSVAPLLSTDAVKPSPKPSSQKSHKQEKNTRTSIPTVSSQEPLSYRHTIQQPKKQQKYTKFSSFEDSTTQLKQDIILSLMPAMEEAAKDVVFAHSDESLPAMVKKVGTSLKFQKKLQMRNALQNLSKKYSADSFRTEVNQTINSTIEDVITKILQDKSTDLTEADYYAQHEKAVLNRLKKEGALGQYRSFTEKKNRDHQKGWDEKYQNSGRMLFSGYSTDEDEKTSEYTDSARSSSDDEDTAYDFSDSDETSEDANSISGYSADEDAETSEDTDPVSSSSDDEAIDFFSIFSSSNDNTDSLENAPLDSIDDDAWNIEDAIMKYYDERSARTIALRDDRRAKERTIRTRKKYEIMKVMEAEHKTYGRQPSRRFAKTDIKVS